MDNAAETWWDGFRNGIKPARRILVSDWADENRILPLTSAESGKWRTSRTPYLKEVMDSLSFYSPVEQVKVMKGTQLGFTEAGNNWLGYIIDVAQGPAQMILPTADSAKDHAKMKLNPTIEIVPCLRAKVSEVRSRKGGSTMTHKVFPGGFIQIEGANTNVTFRHKSIQFGFYDDIDGWPLDVDGEGDPLYLAENRTDSFGSRKKIYKVSSPNAEQRSRIIHEYIDSDQRLYFVPCPACGKKQHLEWGGKKVKYGFKWDKGKTGLYLPESTVYVCKHCEERIAEHNKPFMLEGGVWQPQNPTHKHRGYKLPSFYSPLGWLSWEAIAEQFLKANADSGKKKMKSWVTTRKAEPYKVLTKALKYEEIFKRREHYGLIVPIGGMVLTAAVDVQDDRLEAKVTAHGRGYESWGLELKVISGSPTKQETWDALDKLLSKTYQCENGERKRISVTCIDSGGHHTKRVYDYVRAREAQRIYATKGYSTYGKPLVSAPKTNNLGKVKLYMVGTEEGKELYFSLVQNEDEGTGYIHYNEQFDEEYFKQLVSERQDEDGRWKNDHNKRNEALDLEVLSLVALEIINPDWDSLDSFDLSSRAFFSFDYDKHIHDLDINPDLPLIVCADFGSNPLTWVICQTDGRNVFALDEMSIRNVNTMRMGVEFLRKFGGHKAGITLYGSATGGVSAASRGDYGILSDLGFNRLNYKRVDPTLADRVGSINNMLEDVPGNIRLKIDPKCIQLVKDFDRAIWLDDKTDINRTEGRGIASDSLSYYIQQEFPLSNSRPNLNKRFYK